jgi:hypothetical protein
MMREDPRRSAEHRCTCTLAGSLGDKACIAAAVRAGCLRGGADFIHPQIVDDTAAVAEPLT